MAEEVQLTINKAIEDFDSGLKELSHKVGRQMRETEYLCSPNMP